MLVQSENIGSPEGDSTRTEKQSRLQNQDFDFKSSNAGQV